MKSGGSRKNDYTTKLALHLLDCGLDKSECAEWRKWAHRTLNTEQCLELLKLVRLATNDFTAKVALNMVKEAVS